MQINCDGSVQQPGHRHRFQVLGVNTERGIHIVACKIAFPLGERKPWWQLGTGKQDGRDDRHSKLSPLQNWRSQRAGRSRCSLAPLIRRIDSCPYRRGVVSLED